MGVTPAVRGLIALTVTSSESIEPMERVWKVPIKGGKCTRCAYVSSLSSSGSDSEMLVTVSFVTVPSPLELSMAILSWNSQSYLEMPTVNQLNSLAGQSTKHMKTSPPAWPVNILPIYYP